MKNIRLSKTKREEILESVLKEWSRNNPFKETQDIEFQLAEELYNKAFSEKVQTLAKNKDLLPFIDYGERFMVSLNGTLETYRLKEKAPLPVHKSWNGPIISVLEKETETMKLLEEIKEYNNKLLDKREQLKREVSEILASVTTTKELVDLWPEIEPLIPAHLADPSKGINLPVIPVSRLNEKLGLVKKEEQQ